MMRMRGFVLSVAFKQVVFYTFEAHPPFRIMHTSPPMKLLRQRVTPMDKQEGMRKNAKFSEITYPSGLALIRRGKVCDSWDYEKVNKVPYREDAICADHLVVSYGANDFDSMISVLSLANVMQRMRPVKRVPFSCTKGHEPSYDLSRFNRLVREMEITRTASEKQMLRVLKETIRDALVHMHQADVANASSRPLRPVSQALYSAYLQQAFLHWKTGQD